MHKLKLFDYPDMVANLNLLAEYQYEKKINIDISVSLLFSFLSGTPNISVIDASSTKFHDNPELHQLWGEYHFDIMYSQYYNDENEYNTMDYKYFKYIQMRKAEGAYDNAYKKLLLDRCLTPDGCALLIKAMSNFPNIHTIDFSDIFIYNKVKNISRELKHNSSVKHINFQGCALNKIKSLFKSISKSAIETLDISQNSIDFHLIVDNMHYLNSSNICELYMNHLPDFHNPRDKGYYVHQYDLTNVMPAFAGLTQIMSVRKTYHQVLSKFSKALKESSITTIEAENVFYDSFSITYLLKLLISPDTSLYSLDIMNTVTTKEETLKKFYSNIYSIHTNTIKKHLNEEHCCQLSYKHNLGLYNMVINDLNYIAIVETCTVNDLNIPADVYDTLFKFLGNSIDLFHEYNISSDA